jgi:uncharacterized protein (UPF0276 family)
MSNRWQLPNLGFGVGLRTTHYTTIREQHPELDWFEVLSDNYMHSEGRPARILGEIASRYPVVMHGVGMSIGGTDPLDLAYLDRLTALADRIGAAWLSDHICWTGVLGVNGHDLYPMPRTDESLAHMVDRVKRVQDHLGRVLVLENPSTYLSFADDTIPEHVFIQRLAEQSDCGLLLDVNNVYVSCRNHGWDAHTWLDAIPYDRVVQVHLAGHTDHGTHCIDTHNDHVCDAVWALYAEVIRRGGSVSTLLEWDADIPSFATLQAELQRARTLHDTVLTEVHVG